MLSTFDKLKHFVILFGDLVSVLLFSFPLFTMRVTLVQPKYCMFQKSNQTGLKVVGAVVGAVVAAEEDQTTDEKAGEIVTVPEREAETTVARGKTDLETVAISFTITGRTRLHQTNSGVTEAVTGRPLVIPLAVATVTRLINLPEENLVVSEEVEEEEGVAGVEAASKEDAISVERGNLTDTAAVIRGKWSSCFISFV